MALRLKDSIKLIGGRLFSKCVFLFIRLIFLLIRRISWKVSGISCVVDKNLELVGKNPVAQALKLVLWNKFCFQLPPSLQDFILQHDEYIDPEYVIQNDHVSLFFFDPHQDVAVFGEGKPSQTMWHSSCASLITFALYTKSQRLIIMRMTEFHKLCATLPDPKKSLIIIGNTARCGSTLLTQIYECSNKVISYSEPYPLKDLSVMYGKKGFCPEVTQMTRNLVRMYCRPLKCIPNPEGYLLKPTGPALPCAAAIFKLYPQITKTFYLYRNVKKVTKSMYKLSFIVPTVRFVYFFVRFSGTLTSYVFRMGKFPVDGTNRTVSNCHSSGIFLTALTTKMYRRMQDEGHPIVGLLFDDLLANKELGVRAIFKASGLSDSLVFDALTAFDRDSQCNSHISMDIFTKIKPLEYTREDEIESSKILVEMGYPPLEEESKLEGTMDFNRSA